MIYIILPVHNRIDETKKFIQSLQRQTYMKYHLILVDDGSADGTADYVSNKLTNLTLLKGNGKLWWAGSLEKARRYLLNSMDISDENIIMIVNNDTTFDELFLSNIIDDLKEYPESLILAKCYNKDNGEIVDKGVHVNWKSLAFYQAESAEKINVLSTRGLYMKYSTFKEIGPFHPVILPHYGSDYEYTHRAFKKGFNLMVSDRTRIYVNKETTGIRGVNFDISLIELLNNLFLSKKSDYNRIMWTFLVLLSCETKYIPLNMFRIFFNVFKILARWFSKKIKAV